MMKKNSTHNPRLAPGHVSIWLMFALAVSWASAAGGDEVVPKRLTVYEDNMALVQTAVTWSVTEGINVTELKPVSSSVEPASIVVRFPERAGELFVIEQDYLNAVAELSSLLGLNREQEIEIVDSNGDVLRGTLYGYDGASACAT